MGLTFFTPIPFIDFKSSDVTPSRLEKNSKVFEDGIKNDIDPGEPENRNIYEAMEAGKEVTRLPMTLGDALDALEADEMIKSAMPGEMYRVFEHYKRDEWARYNATVTEWDLDTYMDCLP